MSRHAAEVAEVVLTPAKVANWREYADDYRGLQLTRLEAHALLDAWEAVARARALADQWEASAKATWSLLEAGAGASNTALRVAAENRDRAIEIRTVLDGANHG